MALKFTQAISARLPQEIAAGLAETVHRNTDQRIGELQQAARDLAAMTGRLLAVKMLTGIGTYTPTDGTTRARIMLQAAGGGGGGAAGGAGMAVGGGGGPGTLLEIWVGTADTPMLGGAFSCGGSGAGGSSAGADGATGGDSTIVINGVAYTAKGGTGGKGTTSSTAVDAPGGAGQTGSSSGAFVLDESSGRGARGFVIGGASFPGDGASSRFGTGGAAAAGAFGAGGNARGFGSGGGGANAGGAGFAGGAGSPGVIIVEEYS